MPDLSGRTLALLIQLVDEKICALQAQIEASDADDANLADVEEELADCSNVADELREVYNDALKSIGNLPPYASLIRQGPV